MCQPKKNFNFDRENPLSLLKTSENSPKKLIFEVSEFYHGIDAIVSDRFPMIGQPHWTPDITKMGESNDL